MPRFEYHNENTMDKLYKLVFHIGRVLTGHKLNTWIDNRTLLGAQRSKGLIKWDDIVHFGIMQSEESHFLKLKSVFKKGNYHISKTKYGYSIYKKKPFVVANINIYKLQNGKYINVSPLSRKKYPNNYYLPDELNKLDKYDFGSFRIRGPNKEHIDQILTRFYGKHWSTHDFLNGENVELKPREKEAAPEGDMYNEDGEFDEGYYTRNKSTNVVLDLAKKSEKKKVNYKGMIVKSKKNCVKFKDCMKNFNVPMSIYVINCDVNKDRFAKFQKYAKKAGMKVCREKCVYGRDFTYNTICEMQRKGYLSVRATISPVELSIYMSHMNAWQRIANSCAEYGMVLEDDAEVIPQFKDKINKILKGLKKAGNDFDILHLWNGNWMKTRPYSKKVLEVAGVTILKEDSDYGYNAGLVAYILKRDYAKKLIKRGLPIKMPVDMFVGEQQIKNPKENHLFVATTFNKKRECYESPLLDMECGGDVGTGNTTQDYEAVKTHEIVCKK